jgi:hypothetical protein
MPVQKHRLHSRTDLYRRKGGPANGISRLYLFVLQVYVTRWTSWPGLRGCFVGGVLSTVEENISRATESLEVNLSVSLV